MVGGIEWESKWRKVCVGQEDSTEAAQGSEGLDSLVSIQGVAVFRREKLPVAMVASQ